MSSREKVEGILDGRTFLTDSRELPVRLDGVKPPRRGELGYGRVKVRLGDLIRGREVTVEPVGQDRYGLTVAKVTVGSLSVNAEMRKLTSNLCRQATERLGERVPRPSIGLGH